jgi:hypothetical protein
MFRRIIATLALTATAANAQIIERAYAGADHKAHLVLHSGAEKVIAAEEQQVGVENFVISPDHRTVGWSVLVDNCCTSYPVPVTLILYRSGKKIALASGQTVWKWHFMANGDRLAVLWGPTHSWAGQACLYDSRTGKQLGQWWGRGDPPDWAAEWEDEFEH